MDSRMPSEEELLRLRKLHATHERWRVLGLLLVLPILIAQPAIRSTTLSVALVVLVLAVFIYQSLAISVLSRCPRCRSGMTLPRGSCTSCGLRLDLPEAAATSRNAL